MFGFILLGSFCMIIGLYAIIWAKAVDLELEEIKQDIVVENKSIKVDSEEPLLLC